MAGVPFHLTNGSRSSQRKHGAKPPPVRDLSSDEDDDQEQGESDNDEEFDDEVDVHDASEHHEQAEPRNGDEPLSRTNSSSHADKPERVRDRRGRKLGSTKAKKLADLNSLNLRRSSRRVGGDGQDSQPSDAEVIITPKDTPLALSDLAPYAASREKPPFALVQLIDAAIRMSEYKQATEQDICEWIEEYCPYYADIPSDWQHAIHQVLSFNGHFVKLVRPVRNNGRGFLWSIAGMAVPEFNASSPRRHSTHHHATFIQPPPPAGQKKKQDNSHNDDDEVQQRIFVKTHADGGMEAYSSSFLDHMNISDNEDLDDCTVIPIDDRWLKEWDAPVQIPVRALTSLPKVSFRVLDPVPESRPFQQPENYIPFDCARKAVDDDGIQYDMDDDDFAFIDILRRCYGSDNINEQQFEAVMDALEKNYARAEINSIQQIHAADANEHNEEEDIIRCSVCQDTESEDTNEMVFCDNCHLAVHQACYGIINVPEGNWLCESCLSGAEAVKCIACPNRGGPMKRTDKGEWCHASCALWIPETAFEDVVHMQPIVQTEAILEDRWRLSCSLCHVHEGACVQCANAGCTIAFHVSCAVQHCLVMSIREKKGEVIKEIFCLRHTRARNGGHTRSLLDAVSEEMPLKFDPSRISVKSIPSSIKVTPSIAEAIFKHWTMRRFRINGRPLLHSVWVDSSPQSRFYHLDRNLQPLPSPGKFYRFRQFNYRAKTFQQFAFLSLEKLRATHWDVETSNSFARLLVERSHLHRKFVLLLKTLLEESMSALTSLILRLVDKIVQLPAVDLETRLENSFVHSLSAWRDSISSGSYFTFDSFSTDLKQILKSTQPPLNLPARAPAVVLTSASSVSSLASFRPRTGLKDANGTQLSLELTLAALLVIAAQDFKNLLTTTVSTVEEQIKQTKAQMAVLDENIGKTMSEDHILERRRIIEVRRPKLRTLLSDLERTDTYSIFTEPVNTDIVPDYLQVIAEPMDFTTMRAKLETGAYDTDYRAFVANFYRIISNCTLYNAEGSDYYNEAIAVRQAGRKLLKRFARLHPDIDNGVAEMEEHDLCPIIILPSTAEASIELEPAATATPPKRLYKRRKTSESATSSLANEEEEQTEAAPATPEASSTTTTTTPSSKKKGRPRIEQTPSESPAKTVTLSLAQRVIESHANTPTWWVPLSLPDRLQRVLHALVLVDSHGFFLQRVHLPKAMFEEYKAVVPNPMDLSTMTSKLNAGDYTSTAYFQADVHLIADNCIRFNEEDSIYATEAANLKVQCDRLLAPFLKISVKKNAALPGFGSPRRGRRLPDGLAKSSPSDLSDLLDCLETYDLDSLFSGNVRKGDDAVADFGTVRWKLKNGGVTSSRQLQQAVDVIWTKALQRTKKGSDSHNQTLRLQASSNQLFDAYHALFMLAEKESETETLPPASPPTINSPTPATPTSTKKRVRAKASIEEDVVIEQETPRKRSRHGDTPSKASPAAAVAAPAVVATPKRSHSRRLVEPEPEPEPEENGEQEEEEEEEQQEEEIGRRLTRSSPAPIKKGQSHAKTKPAASFQKKRKPGF